MARHGQDKYAVVEGYRVHYVEAGAGEPVILIAGSYSTYRAWNRVMPRLAEHYRLLAVDYLGSGDSDKPPTGFKYTIQEQAHLIACLISQLGFDRAHLIGSSYGGAIVLNLAARYPARVNKVVCIEGGIVKPRNLPGSPLESLLKYPLIGDLFLAAAKTGALNPMLMRLIAGSWYSQMTAADKQEMLEQLHYNIRSAARIPWYWISISHRTCEDFEEAAKNIQAPVLYLYGAASDFLEPLVRDNVRFLETYLPQARITALEGGIHDLEFQKPAEVADLALGFLRGGAKSD
jgi:pimeloyl-ACP methyl ester carboxylesterase